VGAEIGFKMTRFSELKRIEKAIKNNDKEELEWSLRCSKMRISIATTKEHIKYWRKVSNKVSNALDDANQ